jgi:enolase
VGLGCAASHFYYTDARQYRFQGQRVGQQARIQLIEELARTYSLIVVKDPLEEEDF